MGEIKIEKGIAIPVQKHSTIYPFRQMEIGDSLFIAGKHANDLSMGYLKPMKFARRKVTEDGVVGVRVWRIK